MIVDVLPKGSATHYMQELCAPTDTYLRDTEFFCTVEHTLLVIVTVGVIITTLFNRLLSVERGADVATSSVHNQVSVFDSCSLGEPNLSKEASDQSERTTYANENTRSPFKKRQVGIGIAINSY
jgi:hypothetical protein